MKALATLIEMVALLPVSKIWECFKMARYNFKEIRKEAKVWWARL